MAKYKIGSWVQFQVSSQDLLNGYTGVIVKIDPLRGDKRIYEVHFNPGPVGTTDYWLQEDWITLVSLPLEIVLE